MKEFYFLLCDISGFLCLLFIPFILFVFCKKHSCSSDYPGLKVSGDNYYIAIAVAQDMIIKNESEIKVEKDDYNYRVDKLRRLEYEARRWGCTELKDLVSKLRKSFEYLEIL